MCLFAIVTGVAISPVFTAADARVLVATEVILLKPDIDVVAYLFPLEMSALAWLTFWLTVAYFWAPVLVSHQTRCAH